VVNPDGLILTVIAIWGFVNIGIAIWSMAIYFVGASEVSGLTTWKVVGITLLLLIIIAVFAVAVAALLE